MLIKISIKYHQLKISNKTGISLEIALNVFKCLIVSLVLLKFLYILATAPFLFILGGTLCVVNLLWQQECTFYYVPQEEKVHSSSYTFSCAIIKKIENPLYDYIIVARSLLNWKTIQTTEKGKLFMVLVIWPSSNLKFLFAFDFK